VVLLLAANVAAAAGPPFEASGTFVATSIVQSNFRSADGVTFFDYTEEDTIFGTFSGTGLLQTSCVLRASGQGVCRGGTTFRGTVEGEFGIVQLRDVIFFDATTGAFHGTFTVLGGTGGLAGLRGHVSLEGASGAGSYTGQLAFTP
jgi:hypothetical protein